MVREEVRDAVAAVPLIARGEPVPHVDEEVHEMHAGRSSARSSAPGPGAPRGHEPLHADEEQVGDDRERDRQDDADDERRVEVALVAVLDEAPQAALVDDERHRDEADRRDGGEPDPGDDRGQRQRQLHAQQAPGRV